MNKLEIGLPPGCPQTCLKSSFAVKGSVSFKLIRTETKMLIIVVGVREDEEVYEIAERRKLKYNL